MRCGSTKPSASACARRAALPAEGAAEPAIADPARNAIVVHQAREHNLRDVDVTIPRDGMTVVTGVSGSGKSTLAFDIVFAEVPAGPLQVVLRDVRVRYDPAGPFALNGIDLELRAGRRVALIGPSGAGESTVAGLLLRVCELSGGSATLGGADLARYRRPTTSAR